MNENQLVPYFPTPPGVVTLDQARDFDRLVFRQRPDLERFVRTLIRAEFPTLPEDSTMNCVMVTKVNESQRTRQPIRIALLDLARPGKIVMMIVDGKLSLLEGAPRPTEDL